MLFGFVLITSGLLMIVWLSQSLRLFDMLLNSKVSIWLFVRLTMMLIPGYLAIISPIALFAVALFTYNRLITDRELIILRAAGMSPMQLAKPVFTIGVLFTILGFYISLVLVPHAVADFRELRWKVQHDVYVQSVKDYQLVSISIVTSGQFITIVYDRLSTLS